MQISYHKSFEKSYRKKDFFVRRKFQERLELFLSDPFSSELHNHALLGSYQGERSINITGDYRAIFRELSEGKYEFVEFRDIGTHSELYK